MLVKRDSTAECRSSGLKEKAAMFMSLARHPMQTYRWMRFLGADPLLGDIARSPIRFLAKIHRPYLSNRLDCPGRLALLIDHYESLSRAGFAPLIRQAAQAPVSLGTFSGKSGALYEIQLSALEQRQDGEMVLRLVSRMTCVYTAAFVISLRGPAPRITLGSLTGMLATDRDIGIKQVTRDLYGCRPKDLMVTLVRDIGDCLGCRDVVLVGNRNRIPENALHVCKKSSDYDRNWQEMQARMREDGDFELPCMVAEAAGSPLPQPTRRSLLVDFVRQMVRTQVGTQGSAFQQPAVAPPAPAGQPYQPGPEQTSDHRHLQAEAYARLKQSNL